MKTGFINAYANKPIKKRYTYHGLNRDCLIQPDPGPFDDYPIDIPYGPEQERAFNSILDDGVYNRNTSYWTCRNAAIAYAFTVWTGQRWEWYSRLYYVHRFGVGWDTGIITPGAKIIEARITLKVISFKLGPGFDLVVQNGMPTYPHIPRVKSDYNEGYYSGNGGSAPASTASEIVIHLNSEGLNWINAGGITKFMIRSSRDIDGLVPTGTEEMRWDGGDGKTVLVVKYKEPL